jgi:hypothetical protein
MAAESVLFKNPEAKSFYMNVPLVFSNHDEHMMKQLRRSVAL